MPFTELTDNKMLHRIEKVAGRVANRLQDLEKEFSKEHFHTGANGQPYQSPLHFEMFDEPTDIDPLVNRDFLVAIQRILLQAENIMFENKVIYVNEAFVWSKNVSRSLNKYIPQLVTNPNDYKWQPVKMTYEDLKNVTDQHKDEWPTPVNKDTSNLLIKLTFITQLSTTMRHLQESARALNNKSDNCSVV